MLDKINVLLATLFIVTCSPPESKHVSDISPAYENAALKTDAITVFAARVDADIMQIVYAEGSTKASMYEPIRLEEDMSLIRALDLGGGCITSRTHRIATQRYTEITTAQGATHIILCPVDDDVNGLVGATFNKVPSIKDLPVIKDLAEVTGDYL